MISETLLKSTILHLNDLKINHLLCRVLCVLVVDCYSHVYLPYYLCWTRSFLISHLLLTYVLAVSVKCSTFFLISHELLQLKLYLNIIRYEKSVLVSISDLFFCCIVLQLHSVVLLGHILQLYQMQFSTALRDT